MAKSKLSKKVNETLIKLDEMRGGHRAVWSGERYLFHPYDRAFWNRVAEGSWEPDTLAWLKSNLRPGDLFLDVGAWIGPTAIFAHACGARVIAFEPDPFAYERLLFNLNRNGLGEVQTLHGALGTALGTLPLTSERGLGKSFSRLGSSQRPGLLPTAKATPVPVLDWPTVKTIFGFSQAAVLKMDIEGGEFDIFPGLAPALRKTVGKVLISLHGPVLSEEEFSTKLPALREATEQFTRLTDLTGAPWKWSPEKIGAVRTRFTEIVLEP